MADKQADGQEDSDDDSYSSEESFQPIVVTNKVAQTSTSRFDKKDSSAGSLQNSVFSLSSLSKPLSLGIHKNVTLSSLHSLSSGFFSIKSNLPKAKAITKEPQVPAEPVAKVAKAMQVEPTAKAGKASKATNVSNVSNASNVSNVSNASNASNASKATNVSNASKATKATNTTNASKTTNAGKTGKTGKAAQAEPTTKATKTVEATPTAKATQATLAKKNELHPKPVEPFKRPHHNSFVDSNEFFAKKENDLLESQLKESLLSLILSRHRMCAILE